MKTSLHQRKHSDLRFTSLINTLSSRTKLFKPSFYARISLVALISILMTACLSSFPRPQPLPTPQVTLKQFGEADEAVVYFYRAKTGLMGANEKTPPSIFVDQKLIGQLPNGSFQATIISELENKTISVLKNLKDHSFSNVILQQDADITGATRYYIKLKYNKDNEPEIVHVSEAEAKVEMRKLRAMAGTKEKDGIVTPKRNALFY